MTIGRGALLRLTAPALVPVTATVLAAAMPFAVLLGYLHDDSFFYLKTAFNLASGHGSTFDGITVTNGYHPLWLLVLAAFDWCVLLVMDATPEFLTRCAVLLGWLLTAGAYAAAASAFARDGRTRSRTFFLLAAVLVLGLNAIRDIGTEAPVILLLLGMYLATHAAGTGGPRRPILVPGTPFVRGVLLALLFLSRIDVLFTLIPVLLLFEWRAAASMRTRLTLVAPVALAAAGYFTVNHLAFGHLLTVSGTVKSTFPHPVLWENLRSLVTVQANQGLRLALFTGTTVWFAVRVARGSMRSPLAPPLLAASLGWMAFHLQHLCFNVEGIREWYPAGAMFLTAFMLAELVEGRRLVRAASLAAAVAMAVALIVLTRTDDGKWGAAYRYARLLEAHTSADDRILQVDGSGVVGFFSRRRVVNGDGLAAGFEYLAQLRAGDVEGFMRRNGIGFYSTYSAVPGIDEEGRTVYTDAVRRFGGRPLRFDSTQLVLRAPFRFRHPAAPMRGEWMLFRLHAYGDAVP